MKTIEYTYVDRAGWPEGPWSGEPDKVQWQDEATGLPCIAVRQPRSGHWCGYVGVTEGHRYFGKGYDDTDVEVHGGLTFADHCSPSDKEHGICHLPDEGEPDHVWWLGFDCAHCDDYGPLDAQYARDKGYPFTIRTEEIYRTLPYVQSQCRDLARQLVAPPEATGTAI